MSNKEKIILAALELFSKNGYTETSISAIAKHAKVSKGLTYTHFKNKEALLEVTIEKTITEMTAEMLELEAPDLKSIFKVFFNSLKNNSRVIRLCLLLVIHPQTPPKVTTILEKQKQELLELFSQLLKDKFKNNSKNEAKILLATLDGITIEYTTNIDPKYLKNTQQYLTKKYTL